VPEPGSEELATRSVRALALDRMGVLWIGTETGLFRRDPGGGTSLVRQRGLPDEAVISLASANDGIYVGTESTGLVGLVAGRLTSITKREGLANNRVWSLAVDRDQSLWIGTDGGGLQRLSHGRLTTLSTRNGLSNDYVWAIVEDREGSLWVGTNGGGINQLRSGRVVSLTVREGLPSDFVWSILRTHDGSQYIGTEDGGLAQLRGSTITTFGLREGLEGSARALLEDRRQRLWIGGSHGLFRLEQGQVRPVRRMDRVFSLAEDASGLLWIGTTNGLRAIEGEELRDFSNVEGLSPAAVNMLLVARDGSLWAGTSAGLWRRKGGRFVTYGKEQGLPSLYVTTVLEGPDGTIWAATRGGLASVHEDRIDVLTSRQGLYDDAVMSTLLDDEGGFWMGSNRGLFRASLSDLQDVIAGRRQAVRSRVLGLADGMRSVEVNNAGSARFKDPDGRLWFATRGGAASIPPLRGAKSLPPPVVIEEARADGQLLASGGPWHLAAGTRRLDIHFTALSFQAPSSLRLRHRLVGFDSDWVDAETDRTAHYTNLSHGRYRFEVAAAKNDDAGSEPGAVATLEIEPRLYETLWVRALAFLFLALAGPLFYRQRVRRLGRQKVDLERLVVARTAEVEAANARLAQLVREDALTGVANRRRLDEALEEEWRRGSRRRTPLALALIDVDYFKAYNDRLGHPAGDACLKAVAQAVVETCQRAGELVARYGGEEFAVLLPGVSREQAGTAAENLRQRVLALALPHPESAVGPQLTVSVGVASTQPAIDQKAADLVAAADRALYAAKQAGRNRVELAP
jgi:diguanylate cyclase (GGDEF)-like protein